jgi:hypothetical protein
MTDRFAKHVTVICLLFLLCTAAVVAAQNPTYKKYERRTGRQVILRIITMADEWEFIIGPDSDEESYYVVRDIVRRDGQILGDDIVQINAEGITIGETHFAPDVLTDVRIQPAYQGKEITIEFLSPDTSLSSFGFRRSSGDRVEFDANVIIAEDEFDSVTR